MRLPDGDLRLDRPWTEGPAVPFLGLVPDADVLVVMLRPLAMMSPLEFNLAETLDRVILLAEGCGARVWVKTMNLPGIRAAQPGFGLETWLGMPDERGASFDPDAELGQAMTQGDPLPNGRPVTHLVWMDDGTNLPGDILRHFEKRGLPFTLMVGSESPVARDQEFVRLFLRKQRPGMRALGLTELATEEVRHETAVLHAAIDAEASPPEGPAARPARRL